MNSSSDFQGVVKASSSKTSEPLRLTIKIRGLGHVVSFKNTKMILPAKGSRRAMLITDPKKRKLMDLYTQLIEFALCSAYQTAGGETQTGLSRQSWIAVSMPLDDSLDWIPESDGYRTEQVQPGQEGMDIIIERITP